MVVLIIAAWVVSGVLAYSYYMRRDFSMFLPFPWWDYILACCIGFFLGPFAWPVGYFIHRN